MKQRDKKITLSRVNPPRKDSRKPPYVCGSLLKKITKAIETNSKQPIQTRSRSSMILPMMIGLNFLVHNGKIFKLLFINPVMVGRKLGEFVLTRTFKGHCGTKAERAATAKAKGAKK